MKKTLYILTLCLAALMTPSCNKNEPHNGGDTIKPGDGSENTQPEGDSPAVEDLFNIEVYDLHASHCKVKVTPKDLSAPYFCGVATEEYLLNFGELEDMHTTATNFIETMILENGNTSVSELMKTGVYEREVTGLQPEQKFVVFACHTDEIGEITSEIVTVMTTTPAVEVSLNTFEIEVDQITPISAMLYITPSTDDEYIWLEFPDYVFKKNGRDMSNAELKKLLLNYKSFFPLHTNTGEMVHSFDDKLEPDTEYMIIVFGYDGDFTTDLTTYKFRTEKPGDASDVTFEFSYSDLSSRSVSVTFKPSDKTVSYLALVVDEATLNKKGGANAEGVKKLIDSEISLSIRYGEFSSRKDFVKDNAQFGEKTGTFGLEPGKKHYACAVCMDSEGNYASEVAIDEFTAPEEVATTASVTATFDKYFDGDALAGSDPVKFADYAGYAVLPVRFELTDNALDGIFTVFTREEIEEFNPTDDELRSILLNNDYMNVSNFFTSAREDLLLDWNCDYVLCMIGIDAAENVGNLVKVDLPALTKSGASPITDYIPYF